MSKLLGLNLLKILSATRPNLQKCEHLSTKRQKKYPFMILPARDADQSKIIKLMWEAYYPNEPTAIGFGLHKNPDPILDEYMLREISQGHTLIAISRKSGKLAGFSINTVTQKDTPNKILEFSKCITCKPLSQFFEFYAYICASPKLFQKYSTEEIYEIAYVAVHPEFRGKGVAYHLMKESLKLGHQIGQKVVRVDASNVLTARICKKLGMKKVFEIPYDVFADEERKPYMNITHPNVSCQVFVHLCKK